MRKVLFADQLRGVAALLVVLSHLFNVYPFAPALVSATVAGPVVAAPNVWITSLVTQSWINFGPFGVGLFFLVSGFVVPFSLRRHGRAGFLLARGLRIYPTYWAALGVGCLFVVASGRYWDRPLPFGWPGVIANATLTHTVVHRPSIDLVNWTLVVELHFYLFAALARPWLLRCSLLPMAAVVAAALALIGVQALGWIGRPSFLELVAMSLPYMLIGTAFHYHFLGVLRTLPFATVVLALGGAFSGLYAFSAATAHSWIEWASYAYALLAFGLAYGARGRVPDVGVLRWLSRISYPLYAVHVLVGFTLMTWLTAGPWGLSFAGASAVAFVAVLLLAWLLHVVVERWSIAAGARLARTPAAAPVYPGVPALAQPLARGPASPRS